MNPAYPTAFAGIGEWAREAGVPVNEARIRFAQFTILQAIAASRQLREGLVFKGGNALDFIWQPNRSTSDLDFSVDHGVLHDAADEARIKALLERAVAAAAPGVGVAMQVTRVRAQPPGAGRTFVTYQARLTYALPDEPRLRLRLEHGEVIAQGIDLDISINEPICEARWVEVCPDSAIRVATLEDIVAEKLRALLQQPIRNRLRRQDLLDIAVILRGQPELSRGRVAQFLVTKADARNVPVSRAAFHNPGVAERASRDYAALEITTRASFIPYDEALRLLHAFVEELPLPE
ncbi:MAG: nucleotidyl transferase AbiEii/AbiGii toxin family protein [Thermomicrobiales bacterium]